jgi:hypothetical protein
LIFSRNDRLGNSLPLERATFRMGRLVRDFVVYSETPAPPLVKHVKGHQDKDSPFTTLLLPAQLNCEADALATMALAAIESPLLVTAVFPSALCQLYVSNATVTRKIQAALRYSAYAPEMSQYLKERHGWDDVTYDSVCWPAFSAARFTTTNSRFVPKYCHHHLPVGEKANRNNPKYSPKCPACSHPLETNEHFLLCKAPSRLAWRRQFLAALVKELARLFTAPSMQTFMIETIDCLLDGRIILSTGPFSTIAASQNRIGWMQIFRGYWSQSWLEAHIAQVHTFPVRNPKDQEQHQKQQDRWMNKVSSFVMRRCHKLWLLRNNERHGLTPVEKTAALRVTAERELDRLYDFRTACEPRHHLLFFTDLAEHKRQPLQEIRNWISLQSSIIKISCECHRDANQHQHAGTQYPLHLGGAIASPRRGSHS